MTSSSTKGAPWSAKQRANHEAKWTPEFKAQRRAEYIQRHKERRAAGKLHPTRRYRVQLEVGDIERLEALKAMSPVKFLRTRPESCLHEGGSVLKAFERCAELFLEEVDEMAVAKAERALERLSLKVPAKDE